jgi:hypothetical protein
LAFERCTAAEGAEECRRSVVKTCVAKHRAVKHLKKTHREVVEKQAKKIAHVVCEGKEGKQLDRCHIKVVKQVKKHFEKVRKHTEKALKKCSCKILAVKSCVGQDNEFVCKSTFVASCHNQCLTTAKLGKDRSHKLAKELCKGNKDCEKKVAEHAKKASKHVHKIAKKVFKNTRRNCKVQAHAKCQAGAEGKQCRKALFAVCHKKHTTRDHHKKAIEKVVDRQCDLVARLVCESKEGREYERCHRRVVKHVKKHLKHVQRHTRKSLRKCACKVQSASTCGVDEEGKVCRKSFLKTCHNECLKNAKAGKKSCTKLAKRICKKDEKCNTKVHEHCKKATKKVHKVVKKVKKVVKRTCHSQAIRKCGNTEEAKECRKAHSTKCQKKRVVKKHRKELKKPLKNKQRKSLMLFVKENTEKNLKNATKES